MHKIDGTGATQDNEFTEGNPISGVPATEVTDDWLNSVQRELLAVLAAASIAPSKFDDAQLLAAIQLLIPKYFKDRQLLNGTAGHACLAGRLYIQWGQGLCGAGGAEGPDITYSLAFSNVYGTWPMHGPTSTSPLKYSISSGSITGFRIRSDAGSSVSCAWFSIGLIPAEV